MRIGHLASCFGLTIGRIEMKFCENIEWPLVMNCNDFCLKLEKIMVVAVILKKMCIGHLAVCFD